MIHINDLKEKIIQKFKFVIKTILKVIMAKLIPIILICFVVLLCISGFTYFITVDDGTYDEDDWSNTGFAVSELALSKATLDNIVASDDGWSINMDLDATVDEIIQTLKDKNGVLDKYISNRNVKEYIKAFIRAELITQYPDLRSANKIGTAVKDNEIQGCIQIHRASSSSTNGETSLLTYIDYSTFESYISNGNEIATKHFTLDTNGNLVVAGWTRVTTNVESNVPGVENIQDQIQYSLTTNSIDYKSLLKQYTMPFDFLWALTVMGEDEDFAYNVAKLALDSKIIITVQDNLTTVTTDIVEEYETQEKIKKSAWITAIVDEVSYSKRVTKENENNPVYYYTKTNVKDETCRTNIDITYANTWLIEYTNPYSNVIPGENENEDIVPIDDTEYELKESGTLDSDSSISSALYDYKVEKCGGLANYLLKLRNGDVSGSIGTIYYSKYERLLNRKTTTTVTTTYNTYTKGTPNVIEKTDKNSSEANFVTLFIEHDKANKNILSAPEWLFEMLEGSPKASDMVDIMKYLLYKATGKDYGVTELDLSIYNSATFNSVSGLNLLKEYIRYWEHATLPPTNADGTKYIIETDGAGHPTVGYGVDIENSGYKQLFIDAGYPTTVGGEVDIEFVDAIEEKIIANALSQIKLMTSDLNLTGYQINALVSRAYNCGISGAISVTRGSPSLNFASSYNKYWNQETDDKFEEQDSNADFSHSLYTQYMCKPVTSDGNYMAGLERRRKSEWILFQTGYYNVLDKWHSSASSLLEAADIVHQQEITWTYSVGGDLYWNNIEMSLNNPNKVTCCATYVSCAIYYAGYFTEEQMNNFSNYNYCPSLYKDLRNAGWQVINSYNELEPGDVVFTNNIADGDYFDHVQIYAGDDTWYNAGSTNAIQRASPYSQGNWARQYFYVALRPN